MSNTLARSIGFATFIGAGIAFAAGLRVESGGAWSEVAGAEGDKLVELSTQADFFGVQAVKLWDFDKRTCRIQLEQGSLNAHGSAVLDAAKVCEPKLNQSWKRADIGAGQFVTGISVCTAKGKEASPRLRGVELRGAAVTGAAKLVPAKKPVKLEFAGCEKWSKPVACASGQIATALRAHVSGDDGVVGFSLRCQAVRTAQ